MEDTSFKRYNGFPDPLAISSKKKSREYILAYGKAIENEWFSGNRSFFQSRKARFEENRSYAKGSQDTTRYKELYNATGDNSFLNLDFTPIPITKKYVKIILNSILELSYELNIVANDPISSSERDQVKNKLIGAMMNKGFFEKMKKQTGVDPFQDFDEIPETPEEIQLYMDSNFKQSVEIAMEIAVQLTLDANDYNYEVRRRVCEDVIVCGVGVSKTETDPTEGIKTKYVDASNWFTSFCQRPDFKDARYMGEILYLDVSEIRRLTENKLGEKKYREIAEKYAGKYGNDKTIPSDPFFTDMILGTSCFYDSFVIPCINYEFMSADVLNFEEKETSHGNKSFFEKDDSYKEKKSSKYNRSKKTLVIKNVYEGLKVLGVDCMLKWGLRENMIRPDSSKGDIMETKFSYNAYSPSFRNMMEDSVVDSIKPLADAIQITHLKITQIVARVRPQGISIDVAGLEEVDLGEGVVNPLELQEIYDSTGVVYYRSRSIDDGEVYRNPINPMPTNLSELPSLINVYNHYVNEMRNVTGVVPEREGQTKGDQLVGVTEIAIAASNNATYDINHSIKQITKATCLDIMHRIQDVDKDSYLYKYYVQSIGETNMTVIEAMDKISSVSFGLSVDIEPNKTEKLQLEEQINISLRDGKISLDDAWTARQMKSISQAIKFLSIKRKKMEKEEFKKQQALINQNAQQQQQSLMQSAQMEQQRLQAESMMKIQIESEKH